MTNTDTVKQHYGLLGRNISYSLSPAMHNAAFKHFGINAEYKIFDIKSEEVESFFNEHVVGGKVSGLNVTVPYKVTVKELLEKCKQRVVDLSDPHAILTDAINTLKIDGNVISAYNTDSPGFGASLHSDAGYIPPNQYSDERDIFIAGAGGAGRAVLAYLFLTMHCVKFHVYDTELKRLDDIKSIFASWGWPGKKNSINIVSVPSALPEIVKKCELIVNATPLGTKEGDASPIPLEVLGRGMTIYDLVYARETELVKFAKEKNLTAVTGRGMLVNQGALAFKKWTGVGSTPGEMDKLTEVMLKALTAALDRSDK